DGAQERLRKAVIVEKGAKHSTEADDIRLPGELRIVNPAMGDRESDREDDPSHGNPWGVKSFFENPGHYSCASRGVSDLSGAEVSRVDDTHARCEPVEAGYNGHRGERAPGNRVPSVPIAGIGD